MQLFDPTKNEMLQQQQPTELHLSNLGLLLRGPDMRIMHLSRKLETRNRLLQMRLQRTNHNKHERLAVATERILQQPRQLSPQKKSVIHLPQ